MPQGSILGPLLFNLNINDVIETRNAQELRSLYADDISAVVGESATSDLISSLESIVRDLSRWSYSNGLSLNQSKTDLTCFHAKHVDYSVLVRSDSKSIPQKDSVKFLGVHFDSTLGLGKISIYR